MVTGKKKTVQPHRRHRRMSVGDRIFTTVNYVFCFLAACITVYPLIYVFSMSISAPESVVANLVTLFPKGFSLKAYKVVFRDGEFGGPIIIPSGIPWWER